MRLLSLFTAVALAGAAAVAADPPPGLDITFVDTEGGAATLIVTPAGESVLIDCGNPGNRDADRVKLAATAAGLTKIDHLIITHWHLDHYGGVDRLARVIPIANFYDHGIPDSLAEDRRFPELIAAYKAATGGKSKALAPGDELTLKQAAGRPPLTLRCLCGSGKVIPDAPGALENPIAKDNTPKPDDPSDNARSLGFLLTYGDFRFLDLGDLTWNVEYKLVHPTDKIGLVDVYQVTHHGQDSSNNPVLMRTVKPRVAICNNGPRKGGHVSVIANLRRIDGIEAIYQLHRNVTAGDAENAEPAFIANKEAQCQGEAIRLATTADGKSYTVTVGNSGKPRTYQTRAPGRGRDIGRLTSPP